LQSISEDKVNNTRGLPSNQTTKQIGKAIATVLLQYDECKQQIQQLNLIVVRRIWLCNARQQ
jgi:hypothetical protein